MASSEEVARFLAMPPEEREAALEAALSNPKPRPGLQEELDLVEAMSLEELQASCVVPICRCEYIRSHAPVLRAVIKNLLKHHTLEMLRLGYNPAKGDGAKELELYRRSPKPIDREQ